MKLTVWHIAGLAYAAGALYFYNRGANEVPSDRISRALLWPLIVIQGPNA